MTDKLLRRNLAQLNQNSKNQSFESNVQCCLSLIWSVEHCKMKWKGSNNYKIIKRGKTSALIVRYFAFN